MSKRAVGVMPPEWARHHGTWISWPRNRDTWPGVLEQARHAMAELVVALAPHEKVYINVADAGEAEQVRTLLDGRVPADTVSLEPIATDDAWIRDYGAIIVAAGDGSARPLALDFDYNAWGGKYPPFERDRRVAGQMATRLQVDRVEVPMVLEGGSVDINGAGLGMLTEQCLLNPNRNPQMQRSEIEATLSQHLGVTTWIWLGDGVVGDDTDGHIDNLARFVATDRVVAAVASDTADPNHAPLADNLAVLKDFRDGDGRALDVIGLPLPPPVMHEGTRLPASYANFYIANEVVVVPSYAAPTDDVAVGVLRDCFPDRAVVSIDCRALIVGLGALHCLTQQIPAMVADSAQR